MQHESLHWNREVGLIVVCDVAQSSVEHLQVRVVNVRHIDVRVIAGWNRRQPVNSGVGACVIEIVNDFRKALKLKIAGHQGIRGKCL